MYARFASFYDNDALLLLVDTNDAKLHERLSTIPSIPLIAIELIGTLASA